MAFPATLKLEETTHDRFRAYCAEHGYIMAKIASRVLDEWMDANGGKEPEAQGPMPDAKTAA